MEEKMNSTEWISAENGLPDNELVLVYVPPEAERVLAHIPEHNYFVAEFHSGKWWNDEVGYVDGVTHWMPLPEPPTNLNRG